MTCLSPCATIFFTLSITSFQMILMLDHYKYVYNGGCASAEQLYPSKIKSTKEESVELCYELCRDTENCAYFEYDSSANKLCHLHSTGITRGNGYPSVKCYKMEVCRDDKKGDGKCDEINNRAECHYDSGDCCKKEWIGDGECDERNRFVTCNNDGLRYKSDQTHDGNDFYHQLDGGDCEPRVCMEDKGDPLEAAFITKFGPSWHNQLRGNQSLRNGTYLDRVDGGTSDEQSYFPEITNTNECAALGCMFLSQCKASDGCWLFDQSWELERVVCKTNSAWVGGKPGCYCHPYVASIAFRCCISGNWDNGPLYSDCSTDLLSSENPCNPNINDIITWDDVKGPLTPDGNVCCRGEDPTDKTKPCHPLCYPTHSTISLASRIKNSKGRPKRLKKANN